MESALTKIILAVLVHACVLHAETDIDECPDIGCRELRARRYISDGFCTTERPVLELVCEGRCLPRAELDPKVEVSEYSGPAEWTCVNDRVVRKKVLLLCQDGSTRFYRIKVVKSCKCKKGGNINHVKSWRNSRK